MGIEGSQGDIASRPAFALSKMIATKAWQEGTRVLPRNITPSDVDFGFVNPVVSGEKGPVWGRCLAFHDYNSPTSSEYGDLVLCEFSRCKRQWVNLDNSQLRLYWSLLAYKTNLVLALCRHSVDPEDERFICSRHDVESYQTAVWVDQFGIVCGPVIHGNDKWQEFIFDFYKYPIERIRDKIIAEELLN